MIDVNSGSFTGRGKGGLEETITRVNTEAAEEVVRQLRLRDIGGIIVIDFIDMEIKANRDETMRVFRDALARDKTREAPMILSFPSPRFTAVLPGPPETLETVHFIIHHHNNELAALVARASAFNEGAEAAAEGVAQPT